MPRGSRPLSDRLPDEPPVDVGAAPDPVAAVLEAAATGRLLALRTSGTTGRPRAVVRTTGSWFRSFDHVASLTSLGAGARVWLPGPLSATLTLFAATLARVRGATVVDEPHGASHAHLTPTQLLRALDQGHRLDRVHVTVAGDRLAGGLRARAEAAGATVSHYYGTAELSFVAWGSDAGDLRAFPDVEAEIRDGEIWVRSPYVCEGYTGTAGHPGPLRRDPAGFASVGDRGTLVDGVLTVTGRGDAAVLTGGATVLVADVEAALRPVARGEVVVLGLPHPTLGQVVCAVLTDAGDLPALHAASHRALAPAQRPRQWFHVPAPPVTDAGKVHREALARRVAGDRAEGVDGVVRLVPRRERLGPR